MRKIILAMSVSVDGFISGPDGDIDWHRVDEEVHGHFNEELRQMSAFLDGRITYELMASYWPTPMAHPEWQISANAMMPIRYNGPPRRGSVVKAKWLYSSGTNASWMW